MPPMRSCPITACPRLTASPPWRSRRAGLQFQTKRVETKKDFLRELEQNAPDAILSDHGLPSFDGFAALAIAQIGPAISDQTGRNEERFSPRIGAECPRCDPVRSRLALV